MPEGQPPYDRLRHHTLKNKYWEYFIMLKNKRVYLQCCPHPLHSLSLSLCLSLSLSLCNSLFPFCFWRVTSVECASLISLDISLSSFAACVSRLLGCRLSQRSQAKANIWISEIAPFSLIAEQKAKEGTASLLVRFCFNVLFWSGCLFNRLMHLMLPPLRNAPRKWFCFYWILMLEGCWIHSVT